MSSELPDSLLLLLEDPPIRGDDLKQYRETVLVSQVLLQAQYKHVANRT